MTRHTCGECKWRKEVEYSEYRTHWKEFGCTRFPPGMVQPEAEFGPAVFYPPVKLGTLACGEFSLGERLGGR